MPEGIELPEHHHDHGDNPLVLPVSLTISILAVLVAVVTLLGHRAHTEELSRETQAASRWTQYQAKSIRQHEAENTSDVVNLVAGLDKEKGEALRKKYEKQLEHYASDKEDVSEQAKELEVERDLAARKADRFDGAEPDVLARIVGVRHDQARGPFEADELFKAGGADFLIGERDEVQRGSWRGSWIWRLQTRPSAGFNTTWPAKRNLYHTATAMNLVAMYASSAKQLGKA